MRRDEKPQLYAKHNANPKNHINSLENYKKNKYNSYVMCIFPWMCARVRKDVCNVLQTGIFRNSAIHINAYTTFQTCENQLRMLEIVRTCCRVDVVIDDGCAPHGDDDDD